MYIEHAFYSLTLSVSHTHSVGYHVTLLCIVKVPCLYAQIKTVITFHYNRVAHTISCRRGVVSFTKNIRG